MFEASFKPSKGTDKIPDSVRIMEHCLGSRDKKLKALADSCKEGNLRLNIDKRFIDARHGTPKINYRFDFEDNAAFEQRENEIMSLAFPHKEKAKELAGNVLRPVVVGSGPAGLFAALILSRYGLRPILIERGEAMEQRVRTTESYKDGRSRINPKSNIQFGEGGAGTFSDGKLYTGVSSGLKAFIGRMFVVHGAPKDILYDSHPHIGTDYLRKSVVGIRNDIISLGGEVMFNTLFQGYRIENGKLYSIVVETETEQKEIRCDKLILAIGHSSRDTFRALDRLGIMMEPKPFSVGVRIEHLRRDIDISQYGMDTEESPELSAANYKLAVDTGTGRKLYTFCMCPGGEVIAAQTNQGTVCTNGMSYRARDGVNSNSALLVPVDSSDYGPGVLAGIDYQEKIEHLAFIEGGSDGCAPVTRYEDLCNGRITTEFGKIKPTFKPGVRPADFARIFDPVVLDSIKDGIGRMGTRIKGFDCPDAVLTAVEARSSSPVRILRDRETYESVNVPGLYPCGEGAGYAGGIMSSAIDGINCANALISSYI